MSQGSSDERTVFDRVEEGLTKNGPEGAFDALATALEEAGDFHRLFETRLMRARRELGLPLLHRFAADELKGDARDAFEQRMIEACREVGQKMLTAGDIAGAYSYLEMIGELDDVRGTLESTSPPPEELGNYIDLAFTRGVHPTRGIELILENYGLCQAISACESVLRPGVSSATRDECIRRVLNAAHSELIERLAHELERRDGTAPTAGSVSDLIADRDWLFEEDNYHVDTSHLSAIVRMTRLLSANDDR